MKRVGDQIDKTQVKFGGEVKIKFGMGDEMNWNRTKDCGTFDRWMIQI